MSNLTKGHFFDLDKFNERFKKWGNGWAKIYIKRKDYTNRAGNPSTIYTIYFKEVLKNKIFDKMEIGVPRPKVEAENMINIDAVINFFIDRVIDKAYGDYFKKLEKS